jgi:hypothetical protein
MKRLVLAVIAAVSLLFLGQGTLRAAGQPDSNPRQTGGAAPGHKQLDEQKYQRSPAESAARANNRPSSSK